MRIKSHIVTGARILAMAYAVALTSCTSPFKDEMHTAPHKSITFNTPQSTKGSLVTSSELFTNFGVYAYDISTTPFAPASSLPDFMHNIKVENSDGTWSYSPPQFWPEGEFSTLHFFAYAPYASSNNGITPSSRETAGTPYLHYTMPSSVTEQPDIMIGKYTISPTDGNVALTFHHALASIAFKISGDEAAQATKLAISGIVDDGALKMELTESSAPQWYDKQSASTTPYEVAITQGENGAATDSKSYLMAIPQTLGNDVKVEVYYNDEVAEFTLPAGIEWKASKTYTYNIVLGGSCGNVIELEGVENCYVINPEEGAEYSFDAVTRVNQFWGTASNGGVDAEHPSVTADGAGYLALGSRTNSLSSTDKWYMEVIWSDFPTADPITFTQNSSSYGIGHEEAQFTLNATDHGNVLIGLKKRGEDHYLWSWHLWITDYDPDAASASVRLPSKGSSGFYNNSREIMDRNLGATANAQLSKESYGLYYQWGRKDPFFYSGYYHNDATLSTETETTTVNNAQDGSVVNSVYNPDIFYYSFGAPYDPYSPPIYSLGDTNKDGYNRWGGTTGKSSYMSFENDKTIYDPCPKGWRVPSGADWSGLEYSDLTWSGDWGMYKNTYFAPAGKRDMLASILFTDGAAGYYWSASPCQATATYVKSYSLTWQSNNATPKDTYYRAYGYSIRPIKIITK